MLSLFRALHCQNLSLPNNKRLIPRKTPFPSHRSPIPPKIFLSPSPHIMAKGRAFTRYRNMKTPRLSTLVIIASLCALFLLTPFNSTTETPTFPSSLRWDTGGLNSKGTVDTTIASVVDVIPVLTSEEMEAGKERVRGVVDEGERMLRGADLGLIGGERLDAGKKFVEEAKKDGVEEDGKMEVVKDLMGEVSLITGAGDQVTDAAKESIAMESGKKGEEYKTGPLSDSNPACLKHIIYDKPVKTGSTAVTVALQKWLDSKEQRYVECTFESCGIAGREVCDGKREKVHFVEHISPEEGLLECLKGLGYYRVTSIREPLERWESAFLYNKKKKASHYGIAYNETYANFMSLYPDCSLFDYYDGMGKRCEMGKLGVGQRIDRIVGRYEEIIDLYHEDEGMGQLHVILREGLAEENKSPRPNGEFRQDFDRRRLEPEERLYKAFKEKQRWLVGKVPKLCN